jgi:dipeptidyl aminopeptidase/acylaminoacyl peptidase
MLFRDAGPQATDIFAMDTDGRNRRLAVTLPKEQLYPAYSPDMSRIAFASLHAGNSRRDRGIYTTDADGSNLTRLFDRPGSYDSAPNWSPDGERIAFESNLDGDMEVYVMDANGSNVEKLTDNRIHDEGPSWSPDGRRMVFTRGASEFVDPDVYVMNVDGTGERRLTDAPNRDESPDWQPIPHSGDYESCGDVVEEGAGPWSVKAAGKGLSCAKARGVSSRWARSASSGQGDDSIEGFVCASSDAGYPALKVECTHHGNLPDARGNDKSILFVWREGGGEAARPASMEAAGTRAGARGHPGGLAAGREGDGGAVPADEE